jgi:hypothetical protein
MHKLLILLFAAFAFSGCATSSSTGGPSQKQLSGLSVIQDYQVPRASVPCTMNPVVDVDRMIKGVFVVATQRGHRVDGTHAKDDLLIFSKQGTAGPIVVGIFIFINPVTGQMVIEDIHHSMMPDFEAGLRYKNEVVKFVSQGP